MNIAGSEGIIDVYVQVKDSEGNAGLVMSSQVLYDITAPDMEDLSLLDNPNAARNDVTKEKAVEVAATAGLETADYAAPLARFEMTFQGEDPEADAFAAGGLRNCPISDECEVALPRAIGDTVLEKQHVLLARVCDKAGNCSDSVESVAVLYDTTPPWVGETTFDLSAEDAQLHEGIYYARTNLYSVLLNTGVAINAAEESSLDPAVDPTESGDVSLADVYGWRMGFDANLIGEPWETFDSTPAAEAEISVRGLGLPFGSTEEEIFLQFKDAAGNVTAVPSPYSFTVALDNEAPSAIFAVNGGAKYVAQPAPNEAGEVAYVTEVTLNFTTTQEDIASVEVSLTGLFDDAQTFSYVPDGITVDLSPDGSGTDVADGEKTVFVRLSDYAGNVTERPTASCSTAPGRKSVPEVDDGAAYITDFNAELSLSCYDELAGVGELDLTVAVDGVGSSPLGTGYDGPYGNAVALSVGETQELKTLSVTCADPAGNLSAVKTVAVTLDSDAPTISSVVLNREKPMRPPTTTWRY